MSARAVAVHATARDLLSKATHKTNGNPPSGFHHREWHVADVWIRCSKSEWGPATWVIQARTSFGRYVTEQLDRQGALRWFERAGVLGNQPAIHQDCSEFPTGGQVGAGS